MAQIHVNSREARTKWRDLLDLIQNSDNEIIIERYGKPIGKLVPYRHSPEMTAFAQTVKEPTALYQTDVLPMMANDGLSNLRSQLSEQLDALPQQALQAVQQLLQVLAVSVPADEEHDIRPLSPTNAAQWVGLLSSGYDGDALDDSESLYE